MDMTVDEALKVSGPEHVLAMLEAQCARVRSQMDRPPVASKKRQRTTSPVKPPMDVDEQPTDHGAKPDDTPMTTSSADHDAKSDGTPMRLPWMTPSGATSTTWQPSDDDVQAFPDVWYFSAYARRRWTGRKSDYRGRQKSAYAAWCQHKTKYNFEG